MEIFKNFKIRFTKKSELPLPNWTVKQLLGEFETIHSINDNVWKELAKQSLFIKYQRKTTWINFATIAIALVAVTINCISIKAFYAQYRPYVGLGIITFSNIENGMHLEIPLINTGTVPANNLTVSIEEINDNGSVRPVIFPQHNTAILFPQGTLGFPINLSNKENFWNLKIAVNYNGVYSGNHSTQINLQFHKNSNVYDILFGLAK